MVPPQPSRECMYIPTCCLHHSLFVIAWHFFIIHIIFLPPAGIWVCSLWLKGTMASGDKARSSELMLAPWMRHWSTEFWDSWSLQAQWEPREQKTWKMVVRGPRRQVFPLHRLTTDVSPPSWGRERMMVSKFNPAISQTNPIIFIWQEENT